MILVLQCIQNSYYIISQTKKNEVLNYYKNMADYIRFAAPMNVTVEKNILFKDITKITKYNLYRKGYSVTEKVDGERNLLIIVKMLIYI